MIHIIPAAGKGSRFDPITRTVPKEMLPLGTKPLIHHALDEANGPAVIVTSPWKWSLFSSYLTPMDYGIDYRYQETPRGLGDAVLQAADLAEQEDRVSVILPDLVVPPEHRLLERMALAAGPDRTVIALQRVPLNQVDRFGIADPVAGSRPTEGEVIQLRGLVEKPSPDDAPSALAVVGRYLITSDIFDRLRNTAPGAGGEVQLTDALNEQAKDGSVYGYIIPTQLGMYDCGVPYDWAQAVRRYADIESD